MNVDKNKNIIKQAYIWGFEEFMSRPGTWLGIALKVLLIVMSLGFVYGLAIGAPFVFAHSSLFENLSHSILKIGLFIGLFILSIALIYLLFYYVMSYISLLIQNSLDVVQGRPLRKFTNRFASHTLVWYAIITSLLLVYPRMVLPFYLHIIFTSLFQVPFFFVLWLLIDKRCSLKSAFSQSWQITKHNLGMVFCLYIIYSVVNLTYILVVTIPVNMLAITYVYEYLQHTYKVKEKAVA